MAGIDLDWCCRIAIEGGEFDKAPRVILVQHSALSGDVRNAWHVTLDGKAVPEPAVPAVQEGSAQLPLAREAAVQPKPVIAIKPQVERTASTPDETT